MAINFISRITNSTAGSIASKFPQMTVSSTRINNSLNWIGKNISSPQNRLILGVTALMSQPFIDLSNKKVDEETRKVSAARTCAKIIAGTSVGFGVRALCNKLLDYTTLLPSKITASTKYPKLRVLFTPMEAVIGVLKDMNQYKKAWGAILALGAMLFTNFLIDAPLTKYLTNKFVDKIHEKEKLKAQQAPAHVKGGVDHEV